MKKFFASKLPPESEPLELIEHGFALRNRLALGLWILLTSLFAAATFVAFGLEDHGIDWFWRIESMVLPSYDLDIIGRHVWIIPLVPIVEVVGFILTILAGIKAVLALFPTPILRMKARMSVTPLPDPDQQP